MVGDYLFNSTLNGLFDSSDAATDLILTETIKLRYAKGQGAQPVSDKIDRDYFDNYRGVGPYSEVWSQFTDPDYLMQLIKLTWNRAKGYKLLIAGSASGELVGALRARGVDAWGIESNRAVHARTPKELKKYNRLGSITDLPFKDEPVRLRLRDQPLPRLRQAGGQGDRRTQPRDPQGPDLRLDHLATCRPR